MPNKHKTAGQIPDQIQVRYQDQGQNSNYDLDLQLQKTRINIYHAHKIDNRGLERGNFRPAWIQVLELGLNNKQQD